MAINVSVHLVSKRLHTLKQLRADSIHNIKIVRCWQTFWIRTLHCIPVWKSTQVFLHDLAVTESLHKIANGILDAHSSSTSLTVIQNKGICVWKMALNNFPLLLGVFVVIEVLIRTQSRRVLWQAENSNTMLSEFYHFQQFTFHRCHLESKEWNWTELYLLSITTVFPAFRIPSFDTTSFFAILELSKVNEVSYTTCSDYTKCAGSRSITLYTRPKLIPSTSS